MNLITGRRKPMLLSIIPGKRETASIILVIALLVFVSSSWARDSLMLVTKKAEKLDLVVGKSLVLKSRNPVDRVSIAAPEIADFMLLSSREIYITGKEPGTTNLTIWQNKNVLAVYDLEVAFDISRLKQEMHKILPDEKELYVTAMHNSITLSGRVSSTAGLSQAVALAEAYAPKGKVINLLEVGGIHQVMLEVRVAEISRSLLKRWGINYAYFKGADFAASTLGGLTEVDITGVTYSSAVNALFSFENDGVTWMGFIDALKEDGLIKILAEPTLIALSGKTASFLAGGETPVPVPQGLGSVAIEYKPFGVSLSFTPTVLSKDRISIEVVPEVSELDYSTALQYSGFVIPGIDTRKASTVIELADGQSFAIAGLLKETVRDRVSRFPLLGDIPVLGNLFRSRTFQRHETELVIIATPHLVKPLDLAKQPLPTDFYNEPGDLRFYFTASMEGKGKGKEKDESETVRGELDGDFGHAVPMPD
jgi:pilus assembly protein CpaC